MIKKVLRVLKHTLKAFTVLAEAAEMKRHFSNIRTSEDMTTKINSWEKRQ